MERAVPEISVVVPVFNEAPNLRELHRRLVATLDSFGRSFEMVFVDDGSTDESVTILRELRAGDHRIRIVQLVRNFGQTPALYAGFSQVRGSIIVSLDGDLQNPPEEITKLIRKLEEGYDVVQGWRENRNDPWTRRLPSKILNGLISRFLGMKVRDLGCGLKVFRREVIERMSQLTHHARYVPAEVFWMGVKMAEVKVEHQERAGGTSKYGLVTLLRLNFDMIASVTSTPIKLVGLVGFLFALGGFGMGARVLYYRLRYGDVNNLGTVVAFFFIIAGVQLIATGLLCEYVSRIYIEVQAKPYFVIKEMIE